MHVLMFGWEFPPFFAGGVGMVCYELAKELATQNIKIDYLMPYAPKEVRSEFAHIIRASTTNGEKKTTTTNSLLPTVSTHQLPSLLTAYQTPQHYQDIYTQYQQLNQKCVQAKNNTGLYGENLLDEVRAFTQKVTKLRQDFSAVDVIHAHDWTTLPAANALGKQLHRPVIGHVHITEYNKAAGQGINPEIYEVEKQGFQEADKLISVSHAIKETLVEHYGIDEHKIEVIHNANIAMKQTKGLVATDTSTPIVSYMGRITAMKGPEHFVEMAHKVLSHCPKTIFIMAGTGDKLSACIAKATQLGIADHFYFHGFYNREEADLLFELSDVFVLPSLLEPFGVTPLEAMQKNTPVIVSKQSGVSEVLQHCLKVDFWDVDKMASAVVSLLSYPLLHKTLTANGLREAQQLTWDKPAQACIQLYKQLARRSIT